MSWSVGSTIFLNIWPIIKTEIKEQNEQHKFGTDLLSLFIKHDMDPHDLAGVDHDLDEIICKYYGDEIPNIETKTSQKTKKELNKYYNDFYKNLAVKLNMKLFKEDGSVYFKGTLGNDISSVFLSIYREGDSEFDFVAGYELATPLSDEEINIRYRENRKSINNKDSLDLLTEAAVEILNMVLHRNNSDWEKTFSSKSSISSYAKMVNRTPILKLPSK